MPGSGIPRSGANASGPKPATPSSSGSSPSGSSPSGSSPSGSSPSGSNAAERALRELASQLVPDKTLESDEDFETLGKLLQQVCQSTLSWLAKALQSRGVFAEEFGAEVTLVFQRSNNPLKTMSFDDLREYLLDWQGKANAETRHYYLEAVLKDMSEHQVGIIAGVKEAVAGVFAKLSPTRIEKLAENAKGWSKGGKVWATYQQMHKELSEEQSKLFNEMITPAIQKGYLHQHGDEANSSPPSD
jgi:predicted component of type VI protein secretion system